MIIRNSTLTATRRTLPLARPASTCQLAPRSPIDSFEPAAPAAQAVVQRSAQSGAVTSSGSGGGFFSGLWSRLKGVVSNLLGQAGTWLSTNAGGLIDKAKTWVSDLVGGLLGKASSWLGGLISAWQTKIGS